MLNVVYKDERRMFMVDAYYLGRRYRKFFRTQKQADRFAEALKNREDKWKTSDDDFLHDIEDMFR
jgi:hypothetical protein